MYVWMCVRVQEYVRVMGSVAMERHAKAMSVFDYYAAAFSPVPA